MLSIADVSCLARAIRRPLASIKGIFPFVVFRRPVMIFPERLEHVPIIQENANLMGEPFPNSIIDDVIFIQTYDLAEILPKTPSLRRPFSF